MKLVSHHNNQTFEIVEDLPEVGFYLYAYDSKGKNTHDYLQDTLQMAKEYAFEEFGVPLESWAMGQEVMCCFCGSSLSFYDAVQLRIMIDRYSDELQTLFTHKDCLNQQLHKSVVRHPELLD
jgi:hypothetical protein